MKKLLNILYVNQPDCYLTLENETVCVQKDNEILLRIPLLNLEGIITFGYAGASPALMRACAGNGVAISFCTPSGRFLARVTGEIQGNVVLRKTQYRISDDEEKSCLFARNFLFGKLYNAKWILERACRDYSLRLDVQRLKAASGQITEVMEPLLRCTDLQLLRGLEGTAAASYFREFDQLILQNKDAFSFDGRHKRPPTDPVNALLSFSYTLLAHDCQSALESVGLDPYVGFLHRDRPGRASLALDLMEELRGVIADRFVLSLINRKELKPNDFITSENGAVRLKDESRKTFLSAWQNRKREVITHPFLKEKLEWGLVPYVQALLCARTLRGDLESYPPFLWK